MKYINAETIKRQKQISKALVKITTYHPLKPDVFVSIHDPPDHRLNESFIVNALFVDRTNPNTTPLSQVKFPWSLFFSTVN